MEIVRPLTGEIRCVALLLKLLCRMKPPMGSTFQFYQIVLNETSFVRYTVNFSKTADGSRLQIHGNWGILNV